jgi:hypothetical protein
MKIPALKWLATIVLATAALGLALASSEAEACCGLFGRCGGGCYGGAYYGPRMGGCGPAGCSAYYGPFGFRRCPPPCAVACDPCGSGGCAPCSSGDCGISPSSTDTIAPAANEDWQKKKTYVEPAPENESGSGLGKAGRLPRTNADSGLGDTGRPRDLQGLENDEFKPAKQSDESDTDGAANGDSSSKGTGSGSSKAGKKGPGVPRLDDGSNTRKTPTINLDEKVAWRSAPARRRIESRPHDANARLVRLPAYPKSDWLPVESESKFASK